METKWTLNLILIGKFEMFITSSFFDTCVTLHDFEARQLFGIKMLPERMTEVQKSVRVQNYKKFGLNALLQNNNGIRSREEQQEDEDDDNATSKWKPKTTTVKKIKEINAPSVSKDCDSLTRLAIETALPRLLLEYYQHHWDSNVNMDQYPYKVKSIVDWESIFIVTIFGLPCCLRKKLGFKHTKEIRETKFLINKSNI